MTNPDTSKPPGQADVRTVGSTDALPVAPALGLSLDAAQMPRKSTLVTHRILLISVLAIALGALAAWAAQLLMFMINVITDLAFYGRVSDVIGPTAREGSFVLSPAGNQLGAWVILIPAIGGLLAGIMARWGSRAIQGHGIPEAMEQILTNESNIPARMTWLKPVSSAFAIGTGGPFGAEGPIISTGGALGSLLGQLLHVTANERKVLLAAGAAAGMAAVFGAPVASLVLAVELLLFELRPRSLIPVALATVTAVGIRYATYGAAPVFPMPNVAEPGGMALISFVLIGAVVGFASVWVTKAVYGVEDLFAKLPIHWMWWPAIGALIAGFIGWIEPRTLGVGYDNIDALVQGHFGLTVLLSFGALKFISWVIALGSGTSGGTLAPLFMIGGSLGAVVGIGINHWLPGIHVNMGIAALVGMAAIFAGSSRALLTAVVFAFETTRQPAALLPLLGGCTAAYLISAVMMRNTIMTEKIARRGVRVPSEYAADYLDQVTVGTACARDVFSLRADQTLAEVRRWLSEGAPEAQHQGFPVVDAGGKVCGVLTRRSLLDPQWHYTLTVGELVTRPPVMVKESHSLREAADHMVAEQVGRLVVVSQTAPHRLVGILTRGDILSAHARRLREARLKDRHIKLGKHRHPASPA
ncbi:chloride channel [Rhodanobacter fulvus Jip2]|jgi:H+/Cl- antiporter ClcA|uniref:Chloride channel n=1 Tax=Rhodanobacter fulvus Jip2 TaxID=1163408 RepID=I4VRM3_9GAMM|nr:chloride channel protein [Rhodanobacter fulvus]EIL89864.1 chloride channel [Rhodanobacter fulvus Jip2]